MPNQRFINTADLSDNPTFTLKIEGSEVSDEYQIISIDILKAVNKISSARITFLDGNPASETFTASDSDLFIPGKVLEILAGYHSNEETIFKGIIISHNIKSRPNKPPMLIIECKHESFKMTSTAKSRYFENLKDSEIIENIIDEYSLSKNINTTEPVHSELVQYYCTDWDFIVNRSDVNGMIVLTNLDKVEVVKPDTSQNPVRELIYGATIYEIDAEIDSRNQVSSVKGKSWDYAEQQIAEADSNNYNFTEPGNISVNDLASASGSTQFNLDHSGKVNNEELRVWAEAKLQRSRLAKIRGTVKFQGVSDVNPGDMIELRGVGERFNGRVFVSGIRHEIGKGNWFIYAQFGISPDWFSEHHQIHSQKASGLISAVNGLQIGVVTQIHNDPDGEHRVLVRVPVIDNNADGIWARITSLDAGNNRGAFFRPELGDEVIVGFINDDPRDAVVLGMLNSSAKPAPLDATDSNDEKGFITRDGIKLIFNDDKKSLQLETPNGNVVTLSDEESSIIIKDENRNQIEMSSSGINLESSNDINIKTSGDINLEGINVNVKASAGLKGEGSSSAEISSAGQTIIKGSIVQIN